MSVLAPCMVCFLQSAALPLWPQADLPLTPQDVLETHGLSVMLFHNSYHRVFGDQKMSGLEVILQDQRIATNGDVRLSPTPSQWDRFLSSKAGSVGLRQMKSPRFATIRIGASLIASTFDPKRRDFGWLCNWIVRFQTRSWAKLG